MQHRHALYATICLALVWFMVFNVTFNNISVYIVAVSFIGGGNRRKPHNVVSFEYASYCLLSLKVINRDIILTVLQTLY